MIDKSRAFLPPVSLVCAIALVGGLMLGGDSSAKFEVDFDDCGLFDGIAIEGGYTIGNDLAVGKFKIEAGQTLELSPDDYEYSGLYSYATVLGTHIIGEDLPDELSDLELYMKLSIPEGTRFSDEKLAKNPDGTVILTRGDNGFDTVSFTLDSVGYQYFIGDYLGDSGIALGGVKLAETEITVRVEPKQYFTEDDGTMWFNFSSNPDDYHIRGIFAEQLSNTDAYIEMTESGFNCYYYDRNSGEIVMSELADMQAVSSRVIGRLDIGETYLRSFRGEDGRVIFATTEEEGLLTLVMVADGEIYTKNITFDYNVRVDGVLTNGAAIFRIEAYGSESEEPRIFIEGFDSDGSPLASVELDPIEQPNEIYLNISNYDSFDALLRDGKLYIIENAAYSVSLGADHDGREPSLELLAEIEEYGIGLVGRLVRMSVIDGGIVQSAYPLSAETASERWVSVKFQFSEE